MNESSRKQNHQETKAVRDEIITEWNLMMSLVFPSSLHI